MSTPHPHPSPGRHHSQQKDHETASSNPIWPSPLELLLSPAPVEVVRPLDCRQPPAIMQVRPCRSQEVSAFSVPKYGGVFLFLTACVLIFILCCTDITENAPKPTILITHSGLPRRPSFCSFRPLSPEEAMEEDFILDSIAWPKTPYLPPYFSLRRVSHPSCSNFTILSKRGGGEWHVGDQLEVWIELFDSHCRPKTYGGDVLLARLHNDEDGAGAAGQVVDHLNGSYSAVFSLLWEGAAHVEVTLVHPSEAVTVLRRLTSRQPDRIYFQSHFRSGLESETTVCNVCLRPTQQPLCNYTDARTGEPWFCYKPESLSCDARVDHSKGGFIQNLTPREESLFKVGFNMKVQILASGPSNVTVYPKKRGIEENSLTFTPSGYYYKHVWRSLGGSTVHQFSLQDITQCLKGKTVHMYGDSTIRQWFEYLNENLPDLKEFDLHSLKQPGPFMALDYANNIMVTYRCHGPPIRYGNVPISELRYIANELDSVIGGANTVIVIGVWSHFSTFPIEVYIRRLMSIRSAVQRLLARAPNTAVIVRTANLKDLTLYETVTNSDWFSLQRDKVLRALFRGMNVHLVDAWEMTLAHQLPHNLHPAPPIIKNMINVLFSHVCPANGS